MTALLDLRLWLSAALAAALLWGGVERMRANDARTDLASYRTTAAESARLAERAERDEEQRRRLAQGKALDEERALTLAARADADSLRGAAAGLQKRLDAAVSAARAARAASAAASSSPPAGDPIGVLAHVLSRCSERVQLLADFADRAHIAGRTCERQYDALSPP